MVKNSLLKTYFIKEDVLISNYMYTDNHRKCMIFIKVVNYHSHEN